MIAVRNPCKPELQITFAGKGTPPTLPECLDPMRACRDASNTCKSTLTWDMEPSVAISGVELIRSPSSDGFDHICPGLSSQSLSSPLPSFQCYHARNCHAATKGVCFFEDHCSWRFYRWTFGCIRVTDGWASCRIVGEGRRNKASGSLALYPIADLQPYAQSYGGLRCVGYEQR